MIGSRAIPRSGSIQLNRRKRRREDRHRAGCDVEDGCSRDDCPYEYAMRTSTSEASIIIRSINDVRDDVLHYMKEKRDVQGPWLAS